MKVLSKTLDVKLAGEKSKFPWEEIFEKYHIGSAGGSVV